MPKNQKYWKHRFSYPDKVEPYYHHLDLRRIDDLDDEGLAYLLAPVKGVDMLDLNETEITNESIKMLTGLEYVKELRVKGCHLDNNCIPDLNKITSLEFLHVKNTDITIDGLLQLRALNLLKTILFSASDVEAIKEKLLQLKAMHPACECIIDGKPYYFDTIDRFMHAIKTWPCTYRLKIKNEALDAAWSKWLINPNGNYMEAEIQGPYALDDIEWVEINPVEKKQEGKLVPVKAVDHSTEVIKLLGDLSFPFILTDGIISAYMLKKESQ